MGDFRHRRPSAGVSTIAISVRDELVGPVRRGGKPVKSGDYPAQGPAGLACVRGVGAQQRRMVVAGHHPKLLADC